MPDPTPTPASAMMDEREAGKYLRLSPRTIFDLARDGNLHPIYHGRAKRYARADLDRYVAERLAEAEAAEVRGTEAHA